MENQQINLAPEVKIVLEEALESLESLRPEMNEIMDGLGMAEVGDRLTAWRDIAVRSMHSWNCNIEDLISKLRSAPRDVEYRIAAIEAADVCNCAISKFYGPGKRSLKELQGLIYLNQLIKENRPAAMALFNEAAKQAGKATNVGEAV